MEDVRVMRAVAEIGDVRALRAAEVRERPVRVKASGGVRTVDDVVRMVEAGAERIGASAGVSIMEEAKGGKGAGSGY